MLRPHSDPVKPAQAAIQLDGVARRFGHRWVLRGVDLTVQRGEVLAMTGRNGSGKTTLLRIIATTLRPTRGTATVLGHDAVSEGGEIRGHVGLLGHQSGLYGDLTAAENLIFSMRMAGRASDGRAIAAALEKVGLAEVANERSRGFSAGMRRRLGLARLLLRPTQILLLDEPYANFDDDAVDVVNSFIADVASAGGVVLLTTHDLTRLAETVSRRVHVDDGLLADVEPGADDARLLQHARVGVMP